MWQGDKCAGTRGHCRSGCPLCGVRGAWQSPRPNPSGHQGFLLPSLGSSATPGSVSLKFLSLNPFLPALHWLTPGSAPHPSRYPHYRCPDLEGGWWEEHCFPGPSPLTDGMGGGGRGGMWRHREEGPSQTSRGPPGARQETAWGKTAAAPAQPQGSELPAARSSPSESEDGDLAIHPDPLLFRSHLPYIYSCFPSFYTAPHLKPVAPLPTFSCAMLRAQYVLNTYCLLNDCVNVRPTVT